MTPIPKVTPESLTYAPWSFSKIETAESCPAQFKHKHVLRTAAALATSDTRVGTAAHAILEKRVLGTSGSEAKKTALDHTPLTGGEVESLRSLEDRIESFLKKFDFFCRQQGVTKVMVEAAWAFDADFRPVDFFAKTAFFRGKVDLGAVTRDNDLIVVDHKSGVAKNLKYDAKKRQQLNTYAALGLASVPGISGVRGAIHFLQGKEDMAIQWMDYVDAKKVRDLHVPWLFGRVNDVAAELARGDFPAKPKLRWPCQWCQFSANCPEFQELYGQAQG